LSDTYKIAKINFITSWAEDIIGPTHFTIYSRHLSRCKFELKFSAVTVLQGVEFPIFLLILAWALEQCSATVLPVITQYTRSNQLIF